MRSCWKWDKKFVRKFGKESLMNVEKKIIRKLYGWFIIFEKLINLNSRAACIWVQQSTHKKKYRSPGLKMRPKGGGAGAKQGVLDWNNVNHF